jgi:hypothetical protein
VTATVARPAPVAARVCWQVASVAAVLVLGFVLARIALGVPVAGFVVAGSDFVDPAQAPGQLPMASDPSGYDGQFVYRLALQPWTTAQTAFGIELDNPAYRQQRILTPLLAWLVSQPPGVSTALALVVVNMLALVAAGWYATRLVVDVGRSPWWALVLAFPACMPISLGRDLTEPLAWAGVLAGLWYARRQRWPAAAAALTVAVLSRETSLLVVAGLAAAEVVHRLRRPVGASPARGRIGAPAWLALPIAVAVGWQLVLWRVWGTLPLHAGGSGNLGIPGVGVLGSVIDGVSGSAGLPGSAMVEVATAIERVGVLLILVVAGVALLRGTAKVTLGEGIAWALAAGLAVALREWTSDVQFLRATNEAVGLSMLIAVSERRMAGRVTRWLGAATVLCVAAEYTLRQ